MYLNEAKNEREKKDLALIIEEVLKQRIQGIQNEKGQWVTASFPKLVYVLDENNIHPDSEYYYLTKLSAECSAKRLVPDYVSAKKMKELKVTDDGVGHVFPPMGCVDGKEVITYKYKDVLYVTSFTRAWHRLAQEFNVKEQSAEGNYYIDLTDVEIYDSSSNGFVECKRIIKNKDKGDWVKITFSNGRSLLCTEDHPLPIINKGRTFARDLEYGDSIHIDTTQYSESNIEIPTPEALELGISDVTDIPSKVFTFTDKSKRDFFEGVYISKGNLNPRENTLNFKTPTKEYALQLMCLVQSMGMYAEVDNTKVKVYPTKERAEYLRVHEGINFTDYYEPPTTAKVVSIQKLGSTGKPSYDVTTASDRFSVSGIQSHNCRSFLSPYLDENGKAKFYGRFNCGVCTINLPHAALTAVEQAKETGEDLFEVFWKVLDERLLLCKRALISRYERLRGTPSDVSPTHWQGGAIARLEVGETIDKFLKGGYSTISLGYAGIYETVMALIGKSHTTEDGKRLAKDIMQVLNDRCDEWKEETGLGFSVYGTPLESSTYAFSKALQRDFGKIKDISNHDYVTNSYHVCVRENIDAFSKLAIEAEFQPLSSGGMISYVESGNMANNIPAVLELLKFMYENITYAEINTKSDYCQVCGYSKEIPVIKDEETDEYIWKCPNCGNSDKRKLNIARRTCGYIGSNFWNKGRTEEIKERVVHIG